MKKGSQSFVHHYELINATLPQLPCSKCVPLKHNDDMICFWGCNWSADPDYAHLYLVTSMEPTA